MAVAKKRFAVASNPRHREKSSRPHAAPKKGNTHMAKSGRPKKNKAARKPSGTKNPFMTHRRKKRNPSGIGAIIGSPKNVLEMGVAGLASAVATRQLPQMVLSTNNTGATGYFANAVTALGMTFLAGSVAGPSAGTGAFVGGLVILLDRILTEQVSPIGQYLTLSGVGDATAMTKLGTVRDGFYFHPNLVNSDGSLYIPDPITQAAVQAVVAKYPGITQPQALQMVTQAGGGGRVGAVNPDVMRRHTASGQLLSSRFQGRFQQH
jgi:hypothetical protein